MGRSWSSILLVGLHLRFGLELVLWNFEAPSTCFLVSLIVNHCQCSQVRVQVLTYAQQLYWLLGLSGYSIEER